ncbi:hypothetical protein HPB48_018953 [Haemaphysalis longicornis]|uniref:Uncharacterized protein n=1 Tax=Haemaphysalis longicornis TaxID=44386 RepID=A0A9J6GHH5_HAELO|nr:hypothetical protein HPB48_018953 [Haemaphysalis longicornis]
MDSLTCLPGKDAAPATARGIIFGRARPEWTTRFVQPIPSCYTDIRSRFHYTFSKLHAAAFTTPPPLYLRSKSKARRASRSSSRHNSTRRPAAAGTGSAAPDELQQLRTMVQEQKGTIEKLTNTIDRLTRQLEELRISQAGGKNAAAAATTTSAIGPAPSQPARPPQGQAGRRSSNSRSSGRRRGKPALSRASHRSHNRQRKTRTPRPPPSGERRSTATTTCKKRRWTRRKTTTTTPSRSSHRRRCRRPAKRRPPARKEHCKDEVLPQGFRRPNADYREYPVQWRKGTLTLKEKGSLRGAAAQSDDTPARSNQRNQPGTHRKSQVEHYGSQPTRQDREPGSKEGNWVYPARNAAREVILVGDANVSKFGADAQKAIGAPGAVGLLYAKKATAATAIRYVKTYERKAKPICRIYVLHVGLVDVLLRAPEETVRNFEANWADRLGDLEVCSIPEITTRGGETRAAVVMANARLEVVQPFAAQIHDLSRVGRQA